MSKSNNNKSLFLYTGLIFVVAIIMIIISFFGQSNLQKNQPIQSDAVSTSSITEKAAQLSEDNRLLLEKNQELQNKNQELRENNMELASQNEAFETEINNNNLLLEIYNYLYKGNKTKAKELLNTVVVENLTENQKTFYNILVKKSK